MKKTILLIASVSAIGFSAVAADNTPPDADNSARNERDSSGETVTADDQSNDPADLKITQAIRKALMADDSLSVDAKNIKVVTNGGQVVLRGPVASAEERAKIEKLAKSAAGTAKVDNKLEVKKS